MSQGIHCDTIVVMTSSHPFKIRNLVDKIGNWTNSYDMRTLSPCPGLLLNCNESKVTSYLSVTLEDDSRFLITPEYRVLNDSSKLIPASDLRKNSRLRLGQMTEMIPRCDDTRLQMYIRESVQDAARIDEMWDKLRHPPNVSSVAVKSVREITSSQPVPFFDLRIPWFHTFAIKVGINIIYVHR